PVQVSPRIRWLAPGPLRVIPGHFGVPRGGRDRLRPPPGLPPPRSRLLLRDLSLTWALHGGRDFGGGHAPGRWDRAGRGWGHAQGGAAGMPRPRSSGPSHPRWRCRGGPGRVQEQ
ncbi:ATG2A protein, partial [Spizella passerina]|nr:ATG2A protein [Spizella passerina]